MNKLIGGLALLSTLFASQAQAGGYSFLSGMQGQWLVEKLVRSPTGKWQVEMGNPLLGNHFYVQENKALLVINGKDYPFLFSDAEGLNLAVQEVDILNPKDKDAINSEDIGYKPTERVQVVTFKDPTPFEKFILFNWFKQVLVLVEGEAYLLKPFYFSLPSSNAAPPHYDRAWALQMNGHYEEAIKEFQEVLKEDPRNVGAYLGWACSLGQISTKDQESQWNVEVKILNKVIELTPESEKQPMDHMLSRHATPYQTAHRMLKEIEIMRSHENDSEM